MAVKRKAYVKVSVDLRNHPKLISSAKALELPKVYVEGHLVNLWSAAIDYADDGDLWRGTDESSILFFESLAEIPSDPWKYMDVFRRDRWIDGWIIHDWLDFESELLISRYSSHQREYLAQTWKKHNRVYGRNTSPPSKQGKLLGSDWEVVGDNSDPPLTPSPKPHTPSPITLKETRINNPKGGVGENGENEPQKLGSLKIASSGFRVRSYPMTEAELTGNALTVKQVFEPFMPLLIMHGILSMEGFYDRIKRSKATPAEWMMLYLDKIHAVYRDRNGTTMLDELESDPVAMTMAGLTPGKAKRRHFPTGSARSLFIEIMMDYFKAQEGGTSKWQGRISGPSITLELGRRKGKRGKIA